jgi:hypothetical protein
MTTREIWQALSAPLAEEGIQRTNKADTKKGYDTTGYGYQWAVDRFNDVLGNDWGYEYRIIRELQGAYKTGTPYFDLTAEVTIWVEIEGKKISRACIGGHLSPAFADAFKGAITNGFKKTAAFYGVGAAAYRGELDDDNAPQDAPPDRATAAPMNARPTETPNVFVLDDAKRATTQHLNRSQINPMKKPFYEQDITSATTKEGLEIIWKSITEDAKKYAEKKDEPQKSDLDIF